MKAIQLRLPILFDGIPRHDPDYQSLPSFGGAPVALGCGIIHILQYRPEGTTGPAAARPCAAEGITPMSPRSGGPRSISLQRAYDDPSDAPGYRVLVDRLWPRGRSREVLRLDEWAREVAPSRELIAWYGHEVERWPEFVKRYRKELASGATKEALHALRAAASGKRLVLVYGARDTEHNQAVVLREVLGK